MMPSIFRDDLWNDWMNFSFPETGRKDYGKPNDTIMKTDVKDSGQEYEVEIELPGFKKEEVRVELKEGNLTVSAAKESAAEQKEAGSKYVRKERYTGNMSRSFYVGEAVTQNEIRARFENGILTLYIPKKDPKKVEEKRYITIE
ncbi:MAG: Hsp20/alpha crystallin family protein [Eubacteriales bacterium]|nr:Hsp20/alpha crystallin family protein [Eubacteriales bacterium]